MINFKEGTMKKNNGITIITLIITIIVIIILVAIYIMRWL